MTSNFTNVWDSPNLKTKELSPLSLLMEILSSFHIDWTSELNHYFQSMWLLKEKEPLRLISSSKPRVTSRLKVLPITWRYSSLYLTMQNSLNSEVLMEQCPMCLIRRPYAGQLSNSEDRESLWWMLVSICLRICHPDIESVISPNREKFQKMPINVTFEIPYFTVSGFQVRYLKI